MGTDAVLPTSAGSAGHSQFSHSRVQLSREPDFAVASLLFVPSRRLIRAADGSEEVVEPRVMQVLVALFRANGAVVGRDDLVASCWDGRIVGDDAINRIISRVRRLQETVGNGIFAVDTVTRVGYRLRLLGSGEAQTHLIQTPEPKRAPSPLPFAGPDLWSRRTLMKSGAALATAVVVPALWSLGRRTRWFGLEGHEPNATARRFYDEGMRAQYFSLVATSEIAETYFRQAAEADPDWPDAWGSLAMSYRHMLDGETNAEQVRLVGELRSAARHALELDPDNAEALVALTLIRSPFRRWQQAEDEYRKLLTRFPTAFILRGHLGRLLRDVGRYSAALKMTSIVVRQQPEIVMPAIYHAQTLWGLGRVHEAEAAYKAIIEHWPKHMAAWDSYVGFLIYSGRAGEAAVFAADREARPAGIPDFVFDRRVWEARAVATREPADIKHARDVFRAFETRLLGLSPSPLPAAFLVPFYAGTGDLDTAFAHLGGYYFGRGRFGAPASRKVGPLTRRDSDFLFMPAVTPLRGDRRFPKLLNELGLVDYWRSTKTAPDVDCSPDVR